MDADEARLARLERQLARVTRLEEQVAYLYQRLGIDPADVDRPAAPMPPHFYEALRRGQKIEAIAVYREVTGAGLAEAKHAVEDMQRRGAY